MTQHPSRTRRLFWCLHVPAVVFIVMLPVVAANDRPELEVKSGRLEVVSTGSTGAQRRYVLKEGIRGASLIAAGKPASASAAFVTWEEPGSETWTAFSRDDGETWSVPRRLQRSLAFRDGNVPPGAAMPAVDHRLSARAGSGLYLIQLNTVSLPEWRALLADQGVEILSYFPHNAYVARIPASRTRRIRSLETVTRVEPFHPAYRLEGSLHDWALERDESTGLKRRPIVLLTFGWGVKGKAPVDSFLRAIGATITENGPSGRVIRAEVTRAQTRKLAAHDDVMWIEPWEPPIDSLDVVRQDSGADFVETTLGYCGTGVVGEVFDNGIFRCPSQSQECQQHYSWGSMLFHRADDPADPNVFPQGLDENFLGPDVPHGTPVFGILFGDGPQEKGLLHCGTGVVANRWWLDNPGIGGTDRFTHTAELKQAPYFASFQTNSWGGPWTSEYGWRSHDLDDIAWQLDIAITQAFGNSQQQLGHPEAWSKNAITVGGIHHLDDADPNNDLWCHSEDCASLSQNECVENPMCYYCELCIPHCQAAGCASVGPASDGRIKPDVHYWFDRISTTSWEVENQAYDGIYADFGGTSAAAPAVAGVLGLMVEMWADNLWATNPQGQTAFHRQPHASTIKALLINNARQYPFSSTQHDKTRTHQGWGRPSAQIAYERAGRSFIIDQRVALEIDDEITYSLKVPANESELKITLVYPDPPAIPPAGDHYINDLDLKVTSPGGVVYYGNYGLDAGNYSIAGGGANPNGVIDTVENIFVANPPNGIWEVTVRASQVNQDAYLNTNGIDDVVFSLVATGATAVCPTTNDCLGCAPGQIGCSPTGASTEQNLGYSRCELPSGEFMECESGATIRVVTTQCERCACCDSRKHACVCPPVCGAQKELVCGDPEY